MGVPGGAKGALAEGPSPARYRGPACTPAGRDGPEDARAQGILTAQVLLCPAPPARGTVATWPRMGDSAVPASPQTWALSPQLSRTCHPHTATAALGTTRRASLHPCHPRLAHGCTGMVPRCWAGTLATHPMPGVAQVAPCSVSMICFVFPTAPSHEQPPAVLPAPAVPTNTLGTAGAAGGHTTGHAPCSAPGQPVGTPAPGPLPHTTHSVPAPCGTSAPRTTLTHTLQTKQTPFLQPQPGSQGTQTRCLGCGFHAGSASRLLHGQGVARWV